MKTPIYKPVTCAQCNSKGTFPYHPDGHLWVKETPHWYFSDQEELFYCRPCNNVILKNLIKEVFGLCGEQGIPVLDIQGKELKLEDIIDL